MSQTVTTRQQPTQTRGDCPECAGTVRPDGSERVCQDCGAVVDATELDRRESWAAMYRDERQHGPARTVGRHDRGLSTDIGWKTDGQGRTLDGATRKKFSRLRRWHSQAKFRSKAERNLAHGFGEIHRVGTAMGYGEACRDQACSLFRQAQDATLLMGRSIEAVASATVYATGRIDGRGARLDSVAEVSRVGEQPIAGAYDTLNRELGLPTPPPDPREYVAELVDPFGGDAELRRRAEQAVSDAPQATVTGKRPQGVAAGAVYLAAQDLGRVDVTQWRLAEAAGVATPTVRSRWQELREVADD
jgi:transcription initiation factor TFIIB